MSKAVASITRAPRTLRRPMALSPLASSARSCVVRVASPEAGIYRSPCNSPAGLTARPPSAGARPRRPSSSETRDPAERALPHWSPVSHWKRRSARSFRCGRRWVCCSLHRRPSPRPWPRPGQGGEDRIQPRFEPRRLFRRVGRRWHRRQWHRRCGWRRSAAVVGRLRRLCGDSLGAEAENPDQREGMAQHWILLAGLP